MRRRNPDNEKRIAAFFADFSAATRRCPFEKHGVERMFPDVPVSILFLRDEDEDYLTLGELKAHPGIRATGAGTEAMRRILDLADKHDLTVLLYPSPLDAGWSRARLMRWYASFGFTFLVEDADERQDSGDYTMVRVPHSKGARRPNPRRRVPSHPPPNFLEDFDAATVRCPVSTSGSRMFPDVPVSIDLEHVDGEHYATLNMFEAHPGIRGTGAGTEAMRRLLDLADKHELIIILDPHPLDSGWSWARLVKWYASFGFVFEEEDEEERKASANYWMMRAPHAKGARRPNPRTRRTRSRR